MSGRVSWPCSALLWQSDQFIACNNFPLSLAVPVVQQITAPSVLYTCTQYGLCSQTGHTPPVSVRLQLSPGTVRPEGRHCHRLSSDGGRYQDCQRGQPQLPAHHPHGQARADGRENLHQPGHFPLVGGDGHPPAARQPPGRGRGLLEGGAGDGPGRGGKKADQEGEEQAGGCSVSEEESGADRRAAGELSYRWWWIEKLFRSINLIEAIIYSLRLTFIQFYDITDVRCCY